MAAAPPRDLDYVLTHWGDDRVALQAVRRRVFVDEQAVPESEEWDEVDPVCLHLLVQRNREPVGTGRLAADGKIGRIAVLSEFRGRGVGAEILRRLLQEARARGLPEVYLHAQVTAMPFYAKQGFVAEGDEFVEAGIPHRRMRLRLE